MIFDGLKALISAPGSPFREVDSATMLAKTPDPSAHLLPAAYITFASERGGPNAYDNATRQRVEALYAVILFLPGDRADVSGGRQADVVETALTALKSLVVGKQSDPSLDPWTFAEASITDFRAGAVVVTALFATGYQLRGNP